MLFRPEFITEEILGINTAVAFEKITNIDRKTYKSWQRKKGTPRESSLNEVCEQFNTKFSSAFGINLNWQPEMFKQELQPTPPWECLFNHPVNEKIFRPIPETKKLVLFLEKEGLKLGSLLKVNKYRKAAECYSALNLKTLNFEDDILRCCKKAESLNDFVRKTFIFHMRVLISELLTSDNLKCNLCRPKYQAKVRS
ncbi:MAG: hypothetical protein JEZ06_22370, partial [Anaerolineaceae bacterium]|nr:hypothetical protein [Anaerolineaceae bacterium]